MKTKAELKEGLAPLLFVSFLHGLQEGFGLSFGNGQNLEIRSPDLLGKLHDMATMVGRVGDGALNGFNYGMGLATNNDGVL